ncbi:Hypp5309 [Branchiostoma lanceolatum]|uniref:Hypp5309 protein n=1 Tax=Branchiostoma lanceolatum TaxID=7740 RepID=A0A8K0AFQ5_BRALA|nr:Hypp5309 [Branchiostoma lanceolatum]
MKNAVSVLLAMALLVSTLAHPVDNQEERGGFVKLSQKRAGCPGHRAACDPTGQTAPKHCCPGYGCAPAVLCLGLDSAGVTFVIYDTFQVTPFVHALKKITMKNAVFVLLAMALLVSALAHPVDKQEESGGSHGSVKLRQERAACPYECDPKGQTPQCCSGYGCAP